MWHHLMFLFFAAAFTAFVFILDATILHWVLVLSLYVVGFLSGVATVFIMRHKKEADTVEDLVNEQKDSGIGERFAERWDEFKRERTVDDPMQEDRDRLAELREAYNRQWYDLERQRRLSRG